MWQKVFPWIEQEIKRFAVRKVRSPRSRCLELFNMQKRKYVLNMDKSDVIISRNLQDMFVLGDRMHSYYSRMFIYQRPPRQNISLR